MISCTDKTIHNSRIRFKNNKPYLAKKIVVTALFFALIAYFIINMHWLTNLLLILFVGLPLFVKIAKQPTEGKGFFGKLTNFYKNMYKNYIIDVLPIEVNIEEENITITLHNAESVWFQTTTEIYHIAKNDVAGILYDDINEDLLIMFQRANIDVLNAKTSKHIRKTKQHDATVCFSIKEMSYIINVLKEFKYPVEALSEIEDAEPEERDPELLVNKMLATIEDAQKATSELLTNEQKEDDNEKEEKQED